MSDEKVTAVNNVLRKTVHQGFPGRIVEVDHHVPAENDVEFIPERKTVVHKVQPFKKDQAFE